MITGFNTDIKHKGVTYHVQTEDKGLDSPLILSLVYVGGHIIASKRTPYGDLLSQGFDEKVLTERLQRQHKLICAAIKAGRVDELKRMNAPNGGASGPEGEAEAAPTAGRKAAAQRRRGQEAAHAPAEEPLGPIPEESPAPALESGQVLDLGEPPRPRVGPPIAEPVRAEPPRAEPSVPRSAPPPVPPAARKPEPEIVILTTLADEVHSLGDLVTRAEPKQAAAQEAQRRSPAVPVVEVPAAAVSVLPPEAVAPAVVEEATGELYLSLLDDEGEFRAGQLVTVKVYVGRGVYGQRPQADAQVTVKVLGTSFRPIIMTALTDAHGVGIVRALLPRFNSGRAAIIIRAVSGDDSTEMRRIIHQ